MKLGSLVCAIFSMTVADERALWRGASVLPSSHKGKAHADARYDVDPEEHLLGLQEKGGGGRGLGGTAADEMVCVGRLDQGPGRQAWQAPPHRTSFRISNLDSIWNRDDGPLVALRGH